MEKQKSTRAFWLILLLLFLPVLIYSLYIRFNTISKAATNTLEAETATLAGSVSRQNDTQAAGGSYLVFGALTSPNTTSTAPTPTRTPTPAATFTPAPTSGTSPVIVGAGDIQCPNANKTSGWSSCRADTTAQVIANINPTAVLPLGDTQYESGELANFRAYYSTAWGRHNAKSYPVIGNHEWGNGNGAGYFDYFENDAGFGTGSSAKRPGLRGKGYYSYNLGSWHIIALNSNIPTDSGQMSWLQQDLAANTNKVCTLVYMHHPYFTSDTRSGRTFADYKAKFATWFKLFYDNNVDIWLAGHDHHYQRFKPSNSSGTVDTARGITQFTVGTGGDNHYWNSDFVPTPNSAANDHTTFGVIKITLHPTSFAFEFVPAVISGAPTPFRDSGSTNCH